MGILLNAVLLVAGLVILVKSADIFVNSSVAIAKHLKIPKVVIGLTIVAMGTSAPEVVISVSAALGGSSQLAMANVTGSNIFNMLFIVGLCTFIFPFYVKLNRISRDFWVCLLSTAVVLVLMIIFADYIPQWGGALLLVGFSVYMFLLIRKTIKDKANFPEEPVENDDKKPKPLWLSIILTLIGAGLIVGGGQLTVFSASNIAEALGVSERIIGLTIVSMGTSLPELVTTLVACKKNEGEFALGFIIGSCLFNLMFVLGIAGVITPLSFDASMLFDMAMLTATTALFFLFCKTGGRLARAEGLIMVVLFTAYMTFVLINPAAA
ncbi:MAG: calcium/sodium antiporter [Defluviitaleaceae bacterium]|nr:calcium/sodium antiporter [Defluviitaleaceae bacterium]